MQKHMPKKTGIRSSLRKISLFPSINKIEDKNMSCTNKLVREFIYISHSNLWDQIKRLNLIRMTISMSYVQIKTSCNKEFIISC